MKVLVVEDHERVLSSIKTGLEFKNWVVDTASDGELGLSMAQSESYDVIILDWMLPKMDGQQLCERLRAEGDSTPILMLTAKSQVNDKVTGLDSGADDYLAKPFAFSELVARLQALTRRPKQLRETVLKLGELQLNQDTGQVHRGTTELSLTKKEFSLLEFLMRHPNQVFSAAQLAERVWSYEADVLPNTAQVYVGYLRKKVDEAFPKHPAYLHTVRGFGYKLVTPT